MENPMLSYAHPSFTGLIGVGREDITPPIGIYARNWGAAEHDVAEGIHRPLTATALTLQAQPQDSPLALVVLDLGWWKTLEDEWHIRGGLIEALSLDPARVMVHLTHTHSGPGICRDDRDKPGGSLVAPYLDRVRESVIRATRQALAARAPATLTWSQGKCDLAQNRDLPDPEKDRIICGFNPSGKADDTLLVGRVTSDSGTIQATLVNYACHPVTLAWQNRLISPDFVGALREVLEAHTGNAPCLFLQGASGELAPREQYTGDTTVADAHGRQLAFGTLATLEGMLPHQTKLEYSGAVESGAPLAIWGHAPQSPPQTLKAILLEAELPLKEMPSVVEIEQELQQCQDRVLAERLLRKRRVRQIVGEGPSTKMSVWIWRVGDAFLVGHPNEAYSWLQTQLRQRFPKQPVAVMNLVNGSCGYLPLPDLYDRDIYQVWQSPFDRGSLEQTYKAAEQAIEQLL